MQHSYVQNQDFKARSGRTVKPLEDGTVKFQGGHGYLAPMSAMDAEEYFQAKSDDRLGRWRVPTEPTLVVYPKSSGDVLVWDEVRADFAVFSRDEALAIGGLMYRQAARAYFEAHPERKLPTEPGTVLQGTGPNRSILHRGYLVNGHKPERPWSAIGGATYDDEGAWRFFQGGQFVVLVRPEDVS